MIQLFQNNGKGLMPATLHYRRGKTTQAFCQVPKKIKVRAERPKTRGAATYVMYTIDKKEFVVLKVKDELTRPINVNVFVACRKEMELFWKELPSD